MVVRPADESTETPSLRLRVWRPTRWEREHFDHGRRGPADPADFGECVYVWAPTDDVFDGIADEKDRRELHASLGLLDPDRSHEERAVSKLAAIIETIDCILERAGSAVWSPSQISVATSDLDRLNLRQNRLRTLRHQLQWVLDVFASAPNASVTVR